ncbi:hypothetical protein F4803DRAFT_546941 [Xylaria telfairii]|nr:hypothetical protein F4803DRAFT_546941 [Xylaria telfairii]
MLRSILLLVPAFGLVTQATELYWPLPAQHSGGQLMTCESTYGNGSIPCGGPESTWCFNPGLGQVCCPDNGFCNGGSRCAPVAGYCCPEDNEECARTEESDKPSSAIKQSTITSSTGAMRTFTVKPFLAASPRPTLTNTPKSNVEGMVEPSIEPLTEFVAGSSTICRGKPAISTPMVIQVSNTSASHPNQVPTSVSTVVQVSIAAESRPLISYIAAVAVGSAIVFL